MHNIIENPPKISVITPSYNQGRFIEQTIQSVINQGYPNIEYIIIDGGSNDETVEIIKKYEGHIKYWHSKKDKGQGDAINYGFSLATGDILCWLNSDDVYIPGALLTIARQFENIHSPTILFGNCIQFDDKKHKASISDVVSKHAAMDLELCDYIVQPSSFWNRSAWDLAGNINIEYHYAFDWEWFIRAKNKGVILYPINDPLSLYRVHEAHKSGSGDEKRHLELCRIYENKGVAVRNAYNKWDRLRTKYSKLPKLLHASDLAGSSVLKKTIHKIFFRDIDFDVFDHIYRM